MNKLFKNDLTKNEIKILEKLYDDEKEKGGSWDYYSRYGYVLKTSDTIFKFHKIDFKYIIEVLENDGEDFETEEYYHYDRFEDAVIEYGEFLRGEKEWIKKQ